MAVLDCYPTWHPKFAPMRGGPADLRILNSGCRTDELGEIRCDPEAMRASAEKQLQASGFWPADKPLTLLTYTLARYMHSEVGDGTVEERVAVGEVAVNQAARRKTDVNGLLLFTQPSKLYGEINVPGHGNIGNRFAATSRDPSVLTTLLADLVMSGKSENINLGADDQDGLEFRAFFPVPMERVLCEAFGKKRTGCTQSGGSYWVGPIPGVDHWKTAQFRKLGLDANSFEGQQLIERARKVFGNPVYDANGIIAQSLRPVWSASLPICTNVPGQPAQTSGRQFLAGLLLVGGFVGLGYGAIRLAKKFATTAVLRGRRRERRR
jgi:hypothetical protein